MEISAEDFDGDVSYLIIYLLSHGPMYQNSQIGIFWWGLGRDFQTLCGYNSDILPDRGLSKYNNPIGHYMTWQPHFGQLSITLPSWVLHSFFLSPVGYLFMLSFPSWVLYSCFPSPVGYFIHAFIPQLGTLFILSFPSWVLYSYFHSPVGYFIHTFIPQLGTLFMLSFRGLPLFPFILPFLNDVR